MYAKLDNYWWVPPVLSGALLTLTFHPFDLWPLGFVALVPLYYVVAAHHPGRSFWRTFWSGFITGGLFSFALSYFTLIQFHWLPETYLFTDLVHLAVIPITFIGGSICGLALIVYRRLYSHSVFLNALLAAAVYAAAELALQFIFGGYYLATLAYAAVPFTPLLSIAALGGAQLLSFFIVWVSGLLTEGLIAWRGRRRLYLRALAASVALAAIILIPNWLYLHAPLIAYRELSISVIQVGQRDSAIFGAQKNGTFFWAEAPVLKQAAAATPDLLIYPFSPVEGALYRSSAPAFNKDVLVASETSFGQFLRGVLPASTTLMTWNDLYAGGNFYNEFELWRDGSVVSEYQKRSLFPFMDYTPAWARRIGLYSTPFDVVAGAPDNRLMLDGIPLGSLMCSEIHDSQLARTEARAAPVIIAVGSEAMFLDDVASEFSLRAAQLRAAENDVPVVRGNILGPSGITDRFGALVAIVPAGQGGVASARVALTTPRPTLFNIFGDWVALSLICVILASAWRIRSREKPFQ